MVTAVQKASEPSRLLERIRSEYREMPGLTLTVAQAQRLWALDQPACERVLGTLVESGFLRRTGRGAFVRSAA